MFSHRDLQVTKAKKLKKIFTLKYLVAVLISSILLSALALFLANDTFAVTYPSETVSVNVPKDATKSEISKILKGSGLIKSRIWFHTYTALRGKDVSSSGENPYHISKSSGYDAICRILKNGSTEENTQVRVSIPEGMNIDGIMEIVCDEYGICSKEEFVDAVQNADFSKYPFVSALDKTKSERKYRLEGYLYPDTYYFYSNSSAYAVIDKMLANFSKKVDEKYLNACQKQGMTLDEAVTLGSIIIKEGKNISDYGKISSVFHNRLKSSAFSYRLQSDATTVYALGREMTPDDKALDSPYNTYKYGGLPPSPIASPDLNAISYALYPDSTGYYYFVTKKDGSVLYAKDYQTHLSNIKKAEK